MISSSAFLYGQVRILFVERGHPNSAIIGAGSPECFRPAHSHADWFQSELVRVLPESFAGQTHRLTDSLLSNAATPLRYNSPPRHSTCHLFQHVRYQDACSPEGGLSVANPRISNDVAPY